MDPNVEMWKFKDGLNKDDAVYTGGNVGIGTSNPQAKLDVNGKMISNYVEVKPQDNTYEWWEIKLRSSNTWAYSDVYIDNRANYFRVFGDGSEKFTVNIKDGSTNIAGNTKINGNLETKGNVVVGKDIIMKDGRKILYKDEANKLYAMKKNNLPFTVIGKWWDYLKPDVKWDFRAPIVKQNQYFLEEADGRIIWLRIGYDGKKYGLFYSYFDKAKDKFINTDIQYNLDYFKTNWEYPCKIIWQTEDSVTIKTCTTNAAWESEEKDTYFIITNWDTLNPVENNKHIKKLPSAVPTANWYSSKLYYFASIDKIAYLEPMHFRVFNGDGTEIDYINDFTNTHTRTIFTYDAPDQTDGKWCTQWTYLIMCNHTTHAGIQRWDPYAYYIALDKNGDLIIQNTRMYRERRNWGNYKNWRFTANIKTRFSFKDKKLYYLNQMPLKFDRNNQDANKSNGIINWAPTSLIWRKSYDISYLKRSKKVLMSVSWRYPDAGWDPGYKIWINKGITPAEFIYNDNKLDDIWPENKKWYEKQMYSIPYDASLLWKWLSKTYFVGNKKIYSYAYSYTYSPTWWEWKFRHTVSTLPSLTVSNNSLSIPKKTELVNVDGKDSFFYDHRYDSMYLDNQGKIRIVFVENNKLKVYKEELNNWNGWVETIWDVSTTYYNDVKNNIKNNFSSSLDWDIRWLVVRPLNDRYFIAHFYTWKQTCSDSDDANGKCHKYEWTNKLYAVLYKYNNWKLSRYTWLLKIDQIDKKYPMDKERSVKFVSYINSSKNKLMFWTNGYRTHSYPDHNYGGYDSDVSVIIDLNKKSLIQTKRTNRRNYRWAGDFRPIGIHPDYGPYYVSIPWEEQYIYYDPDHYTGSSLDEKMENVFKNLSFSQKHKVLWVTPAKWFIIYTSSSQITDHGQTDILKTKAYNLPDILWVSENEIKNKTIYAYPNPNNITELKFDLKMDPNKTYIIVIHTTDRWIGSVKLIDGLYINSSQVTVSNIFVNDSIKMIDKKTWKVVILTVEDGKIVIRNLK